MDMEGTTAGIVPEPANIPESEEGFDHSDKNTDQPQTGEATERQAAWRPADQPSAHELYEAAPNDADDVGDADTEGRGI